MVLINVFIVTISTMFNIYIIAAFLFRFYVFFIIRIYLLESRRHFWPQANHVQLSNIA
jgi:hypothetical protein